MKIFSRTSRHVIPCVLFLLLLLSLTACEEYTEFDPPVQSTPVSGEGLTVHFIDVGQADSAFLQCDGMSMLIDGGNVEDSSLIVSYLTDLNTNFIDYVICTHAHEDHVGGLSGPMSQFPVGTVYCPVEEYTTRAFDNFLKYTNEQGLSLTAPQPGAQFTLGEAIVTILGPLETENVSTNNTSIVLRVDYGATSFLFTGDAEYESETALLDADAPLEATVLKVGHHGSSTSTSYRFLRDVNPQYAVISCGVDNSYGHPHDETMSRLRDADVTLYRTDMQGHIVACSDGETVTFQTATGAELDTNPGEVDAGVYIGNINSQVFHRTDCSSLPAEHNQITFDSRQSATQAGYTPCGRCAP